MRLYKYLSISTNDDDISSFRSLNIDLVETKTHNIDLVERIQQRYDLDDKISRLIEDANKELKSIYRGKYIFDFCLEEQGLTPDSMKIDNNKVRQLKEKWFKFNDELSTIQNEFEKNIKRSLQK
jgi:hypothetical protein